MRLGDLFAFRYGDRNADFWVQRNGSERTVGKPTRTFQADWIGVTVRPNSGLDGGFAYYLWEYLWSQGLFALHCTGTLNLKHISTAALRSIRIVGQPQLNVQHFPFRP